MRVQRHAPAATYPQKRPGNHSTGDLVGLIASLDRCGKSRPHLDSIPGPSSLYAVAIPTELPGPPLHFISAQILPSLSYVFRCLCFCYALLYSIGSLVNDLVSTLDALRDFISCSSTNHHFRSALPPCEHHFGLSVILNVLFPLEILIFLFSC